MCNGTRFGWIHAFFRAEDSSKETIEEGNKSRSTAESLRRRVFFTVIVLASRLMADEQLTVNSNGDGSDGELFEFSSRRFCTGPTYLPISGKVVDVRRENRRQ
jgi:hypothetical protein